MISVPLHNQSGEKVGEYELDPADIVDGISKQLLHDVVVMYEANKRQGTFRTKSRGEVAGSTKKMYRQKGTGRARAGSRRSNVRVGGGMAFAKRPRDFSYRLPRKAVRKATRMALLSKFSDEQAIVIDTLALDAIGTKQIASLLKAAGLAGTRTLLVTADHDEKVYLSGRNIAGLQITSASELNAYALLSQRNLVITKEAIDLLRKGPVSKKAEETESEAAAVGADT